MEKASRKQLFWAQGKVLINRLGQDRKIFLEPRALPIELATAKLLNNHSFANDLLVIFHISKWVIATKLFGFRIETLLTILSGQKRCRIERVPYSLNSLGIFFSATFILSCRSPQFTQTGKCIITNIRVVWGSWVSQGHKDRCYQQIQVRMWAQPTRFVSIRANCGMVCHGGWYRGFDYWTSDETCRIFCYHHMHPKRRWSHKVKEIHNFLIDVCQFLVDHDKYQSLSEFISLRSQILIENFGVLYLWFLVKWPSNVFYYSWHFKTAKKNVSWLNFLQRKMFPDWTSIDHFKYFDYDFKYRKMI